MKEKLAVLFAIFSLLLVPMSAQELGETGGSETVEAVILATTINYPDALVAGAA